MSTGKPTRLVLSTSVLIDSFRALHVDDQAFVLSQINQTCKVPDSIVYLARKIGELEGAIKTSLLEHELRVERAVQNATQNTTQTLMEYFEGSATESAEPKNEPVRSVAQAPRPTVLVYGLIGPQSATLKELLKPYPIDVTCIERSAIPPKATFDFVLLSRWFRRADVARLSKHNTKVQVAYGGTATMASHIIAYFNLDDSGETGD